MKKFVLLICVSLLLWVAAAAAFAQGMPAQPYNASPSPSQQSVSSPPPVAQQQGDPKLFYGYVPPPPIRHTWPGGYRVIFHELTNTLIEHILGQY